MKSIEEAKNFLDKLAEKKRGSVFANYFNLGPPRMTEADCLYVEREFGIRLPALYRSLLLAYDWSSLNLANLRFIGSAQELVDRNRAGTNPFHRFCKANHLFEIGNYEADPVLICLEDYSGLEGEIVYIDHSSFPQIEVEFVGGNFERLVVCAVIVLKMRDEVNFYEWDDSQFQNEKEALFSQIMKNILKVEPRANKSSFWNKFVRGF